MARIDLARFTAAAAVGVGDEVFEGLDRNAKDATGAKAPRTKAFQRWTDWYRVGITGLALVGYGMDLLPPAMQSAAEAVALAGTPLVVKSLSYALQKGFGKSAHVPMSGGQLGARLVQIPPAQRPAVSVAAPVTTGGFAWRSDGI